MFENFVGNSLWYLITQSDFISKLILLILLIMSIIGWTVFIAKLILLHLRSKEMRRVQDMLRTVRSIEDLVSISVHVPGTVGSYLIAQTIELIQAVRDVSSAHMSKGDIVQYHIDQSIENLVAHEESYVPILSTSAAVAPLLGLFGTVWGLIHAFIRISEKQAADITVVAPGIAEALITTLAGLIVAIPALIMYNYLIVRVRHIETQMVQLADRIAFIAQQTLG
jgi:biopolymer transport protein ExbB/TolQ